MTFDLNKRHCYWFNELSKIPRGSRNEKAASDFVVQFAKDHGFAYKQDHVWNVIVEKPGTPGYENAPWVILQAHLDMVNVKNQDVEHDFEKDPLDLYVDDEGNLRAKGTTLGCDDGFGCAYMLSLLESTDVPHPPLQCYFTVMEEVGLVGAMQLKKEDIKAKRLINLDLGGETITGISSAGSVIINFKKKTHPVSNDDPTYALRIRGLKGGHSGIAIAEEAGNSIQYAATALREPMLNGLEVQIVSFDGGMKFNAIPHEADVIFTSKEDPEKLAEIFVEKEREFREQLQGSDDGICIVFESVEKAAAHMSVEESKELINFLYLGPTGFQHRSVEIEGLTLASNNLGTVKTEGTTISGEILPRSAVDSYNMSNLYRYQALGELCHVDVENAYMFSGWRYDPNSELREIYREVLAKRGQELTTIATHGGLETGIFKGMVPDMDIICVGPISGGEHTPEEFLNLASFDRTFDILKEILAACH